MSKIKKLYQKHLNEIVLYYASIYHFDMGKDGKTSHNNEGDAFKHCMFQAELTFWFGKIIAKLIGDKHEDNNSYNTPAERNMDLHNNKEGRDTGNRCWAYYTWFDCRKDIYDWIADDIMFKMRSGKLITEITNDNSI